MSTSPLIYTTFENYRAAGFNAIGLYITLLIKYPQWLIKTRTKKHLVCKQASRPSLL